MSPSCRSISDSLRRGSRIRLAESHKAPMPTLSATVDNPVDNQKAKPIPHLIEPLLAECPVGHTSAQRLF